MFTGASESVFAVRRLISAARAHGLALDEGPTAGEPAVFARVSQAHAQRLWERAVRELGPSLPLAVADSIDEHLCLMQFAAMSCRTIGEVVELTATHWRYVTDAFPARIVRRGGPSGGPTGGPSGGPSGRQTGGTIALEFDVAGPLPLGARIGVEYLLATLVRASGELSGGAWRPIELVLGHRPPVSLDDWETVCRVPVRVGDTSRLVIALDSMAQPVRRGLSPAAGPFFRELLACYTPPPAPRFADRVTAALVRDLAAAAPTVEQIAAELGLSARSLHRQLAAEGTSYQRVLDGVRCDEATRQASDESRPFKAIAAAVGFADPRAFRRAFKRWTGTTPQQFRLRSRPGEPSPG